MTRQPSSPALSDGRRPQKRRSCDEGRNPGDARRQRTDTTTSFSPSCQNNTLRFACPFFRARPEKFGPSEICAGRGWTGISRLKEHLYRRHYHRHISCERCLGTFNSEKDLHAHRLQETPCRKVDRKPRDLFKDGMSESVLNELKSRKRISAQDDEKKWFEIYRILFPDDPLPKSPYMNPETYSGRASPELVEDLHRFLRERLPGFVKETFTKGTDIADTVSRCLDGTIQQYLQRPDGDSASSSELIEQEMSRTFSGLTATSCSTTISEPADFLLYPSILQQQPLGEFPIPVIDDQISIIQSPPPIKEEIPSMWTASEDHVLLSARAAGLDFTQIQLSHFPMKYAFECQNRHEQLTEHGIDEANSATATALSVNMTPCSSVATSESWSSTPADSITATVCPATPSQNDQWFDLSTGTSSDLPDFLLYPMQGQNSSLAASKLDDSVITSAGSVDYDFASFADAWENVGNS